MTGLGDTYCSDDELDALALCPSAGGVPDYVGCVCNGGTAVAAATTTASTLTADLSAYWPWLLAAGTAVYFMSGKGRR